VIIRPEAEADLADARRWYERQQAGLGDDLLKCVEEVLVKIQFMPESHRTVYQDIRRAKTRRFPFVVYYQVVLGEAFIIGILHGKRDPRVWKSRG